MSDTATVHVKEVKIGLKTDSWTRYDVIDGNDQRFATFSKSMFEQAQPYVDKRAEIEYEETEKGRKLLSIKAASEQNGDTPPLGTGEYVKGQAAPTDAKRILLCVSWERGIELAELHLKVTPAQEWSPDLLFSMARKYAMDVYGDLLRRSGLFTDDDIPF